MTDDELAILKTFERCGSPCAIFTPRPDEAILAKLKALVASGLLRSIAGPTAISGTNLWFECLILTDIAGREACGLKPILPQPAFVPKKAERTLFD